MEGKEKQVPADNVPVIRLQVDGCTCLIGLHYSSAGKETAEDIIKNIVRKEVKKGNF